MLSTDGLGPCGDGPISGNHLQLPLTIPYKPPSLCPQPVSLLILVQKGGSFGEVALRQSWRTGFSGRAACSAAPPDGLDLCARICT